MENCQERDGRPKPDDFVRVCFDGIKNKDAAKLDEIGRKLFTRPDGSYQRRDVFYYFFFQLRGLDDVVSGMERRLRTEMKEEFRQLLEREIHGKT